MCFLIADDQDIYEFLGDEIAAEKGNLKNLRTPSGFEVKTEKAEVTFTKNDGSEKWVKINKPFEIK